MFNKAGSLKQIESTSKCTVCKWLYIVYLCVLLQRLCKILIVIAIFLQHTYRHKVINLPIYNKDQVTPWVATNVFLLPGSAISAEIIMTPVLQRYQSKT